MAWSPGAVVYAIHRPSGGGELTRVLCVRPDGTGRHLLAGGADSVTVTAIAEPSCCQEPSRADVPDSPPGHADRYHAEAPAPPGTEHAPQWAGRDGRAVLLDPAGGRLGAADGGVRPASHRELEERTLSAYLVDPEGTAAPVLLFSERGAANQRVCDLSRDGRLALVYRGPRGRREALVVRTEDSAVTCAFPVADGDPWVGGFSPSGGTSTGM